MVSKKISCSLVLVGSFLLLMSCKKQSDTYTTVTWKVKNPVTEEGYSGVPVSLFELRNGSGATEMWSGFTDENGEAEYQFKAYNSNNYKYRGSANLSGIGILGVDYSVVSQPSPGTYLLKNKVNTVSYDVMQYAYLKEIINNVNCEGQNDTLIMHMFLKNSDDGIDQEYIREGCYSYETTGSVGGSPDGYRRIYAGTYIYDYEVKRQSGISYGIDSINLSDGEMGTIEINY